MEILEHKGEKFIVKGKARVDMIGNVPLRQIQRNYNAEFTLKHGDIYLFLQYIEPAQFTDITENTEHDKNDEITSNKSTESVSGTTETDRKKPEDQTKSTVQAE